MWFYLVEGVRQGPVAFEHLVHAIQAAPDPAGVLVWREKLASWLPAGTVPELAAKLPPATSAVVLLFTFGVLLLALANTVTMVVTVYRLMSVLDAGAPAIWATAMLLPLITSSSCS